MEKRLMETIRMRVCKEAEEAVNKKSMSPVDMDTLYKATGTMYYLKKMERYDSGGYSQDGNWRANMEGEYSRGHSYNDGGYSQRGYSRDSGGGYSQHGNSVSDKLRRMLNDTSDPRELEMIKRFIHEAER